MHYFCWLITFNERSYDFIRESIKNLKIFTREQGQFLNMKTKPNILFSLLMISVLTLSRLLETRKSKHLISIDSSGVEPLLPMHIFPAGLWVPCVCRVAQCFIQDARFFTSVMPAIPSRENIPHSENICKVADIALSEQVNGTMDVRGIKEVSATVIRYFSA